MKTPSPQQECTSIPQRTPDLVRAALLLLALSTVLAHPHGALGQVTGISYTITPLAERMSFHQNSGLADVYLFGGRVGLGFGESLELSGIYMAAADLTTDFSEFDALGSELLERFEGLPPRELQLRQYGADLKLNLGRGGIFPFISAGTGILHFDPEHLDDSRLIYLSGAAGLQFGLGDRLALQAQVRNLTFRYTPYPTLLSENDLSDLGLGPEDFRPVTARNFALTLGLQMYVGGRRRGELTAVDLALREQFSRGLTGVRFELEPLGGMIDFDGDLGFRQRQRIGGVLAGFNLGPYLGLRGFYWRGIEPESLTEFEPLQAYGGEIHLSFDQIVGSLTPRLILGGGYLDVLSGYAEDELVQPVDRPFATAGADVGFSLTRGIRVHGGVRAMLMSSDASADVSTADQLSTSFFYSGGVSFGLGGRSAQRVLAVDDAPAKQDLEAIQEELARTRREIDQLLRERQMLTGRPPTEWPIDTMRARQLRSDGNWITIPVPERGEFYVRYGDAVGRSAQPPGTVQLDPTTGAEIQGQEAPSGSGATGRSLTAEEIEAIVRDALRRELRSRSLTPEVGAAGISESEQRLLDRIAELERRLELQRPSYMREDRSRDPGLSRQYSVQALLPFAGFGLSSEQVGVAGLRADIRTRSLANARFLPELVAVAGSDGIRYGFNANVGFPINVLLGSFRPYAGVGLGVVTIGGAELVFNMLAGVEQATLQGRFFAEFMSQDFFDLNRFVLGYRISF